MQLRSEQVMNHEELRLMELLEMRPVVGEIDLQGDRVHNVLI